MSLLDLNHANLTQTLLSRLFQSDIRTWLLDYAQPYKELMAYSESQAKRLSQFAPDRGNADLPAQSEKTDEGGGAVPHDFDGLVGQLGTQDSL